MSQAKTANLMRPAARCGSRAGSNVSMTSHQPAERRWRKLKSSGRRPFLFFVADYTPIIEITISARAGTDYGSLRVMDNGPGVPPQHRDKIFNAYERGEAPSGLAPSLGLGLHISRFLAE